jgi:signal transduction histidine kinase
MRTLGAEQPPNARPAGGWLGPLVLAAGVVALAEIAARLGPGFRVVTYAVLAPALVAAVLQLRRGAARRAERTLREVVGAERGAAAARLASGEELHRLVLDSMPAHIAVLDPAGLIVATNEAWERFALENGAAGDGRAGACGVGANYLDACRGATGHDSREGAEVYEGLRAVLAGERREFRDEYRCHGPDRQRWFLLTASPLATSPGERPRGAVVFHFDITERKQSEQSLAHRALELARMARRLKKINEELDQFAYVTSHDLRAPLRGIANLSRWIEEDMGDKFTPEAHEQMELLRGRVERMEKMIDGILEFSRVGRVSQRSERIDVAAVVAEVIDLLDVTPQFKVDVAAGMPVIFGERLRLQQVFLNLIGNAVKHHDKPRGRISVGWRDVPDGDAKGADGKAVQGKAAEGGMVEFSVSDDGPGIDPKYHDLIFVIFQTLQPRDKVEGTGLGLSLVRKIVESQGGTIAVESQPGHGATFRFTWPRNRSGDARDADGVDHQALEEGTGASESSARERSTEWKTVG